MMRRLKMMKTMKAMRMRVRMMRKKRKRRGSPGRSLGNAGLVLRVSSRILRPIPDRPMNRMFQSVSDTYP